MEKKKKKIIKIIKSVILWLYNFDVIFAFYQIYNKKK